MKLKQINNDPNYNVIDEKFLMECCSVETGIYSSGYVCVSLSGWIWYVLRFFINVLMCTAYTNLANTFLISFLSKNSDLSSMLEA